MGFVCVSTSHWLHQGNCSCIVAASLLSPAIHPKQLWVSKNHVHMHVHWCITRCIHTYVHTCILHTYCNLHRLCDTCKVAHRFVAISLDTFHTTGTYILAGYCPSELRAQTEGPTAKKSNCRTKTSIVWLSLPLTALQHCNKAEQPGRVVTPLYWPRVKAHRIVRLWYCPGVALKPLV